MSTNGINWETYDGLPIEKAVIGSVIRDNDLISKLFDNDVSEKSFSTSQNARIWDAIKKLSEDGVGINLPQLGVLLDENDQNAAAECTSFYPVPEVVDGWIKTLKQLEARRQLASEMQALSTRAIKQSPVEAIEAAQIMVDKARKTAKYKEAPGLKDIIDQTIAECIDKPPEILPLFPGGTEGAALVRLARGEMMTVGAMSGQGKTTIAVEMALEMLKAGKRVLYIYTEGASKDIILRMAAVNAGCSHTYFSDTNFDNRELIKEKVGDIGKNFSSNLRIVGADCDIITSDTITNQMRAAVNAFNGTLDAVIVDYLQDVATQKRENSLKSDFDKSTYIARTIHDTLIECQSAGILLSQFTREAMRAGITDKEKPNITWFKSASKATELSHIVTCLYRLGDNGKSCFYSCKTRNIKPFSITLSFDSFTGQYTSAPIIPPRCSPPMIARK